MLDSFHRYPVEQKMAAIAGRRYTTFLTTGSVLPVLLNIGLLLANYDILIYQNLQLYVINTFQFANSSRTTKQHQCKHYVYIVRSAVGHFCCHRLPASDTSRLT